MIVKKYIITLVIPLLILTCGFQAVPRKRVTYNKKINHTKKPVQQTKKPIQYDLKCSA
jgi:hypothetical protein